MSSIPDMISKFLNYLRYELNRAPLTVKAYETDILQFQEWLSPDNPDGMDFLSVTSSDIRAWLASMARKGDTPRTLRRKIISLRTLFKWMMKTNLLRHSPLEDVPLPKLPKPLPDIIKPDEIETALQNIINDDSKKEKIKIRDSLIVEMFYSLGIRRAELTGINDSDISFSKGELKVTGKRSKQRVIPLPQKLAEKIKEWQQIRDRDQEHPVPDSPLFTTFGRRIHEQHIYGIVKKSLQNANSKKKSPHVLRHSFASGMLNGGADLDSVREFLGHESLATTQIYTHISLKEIKKAYNNAHPRSSKDKD